jgi:serine/threonine protein kinase
VTRAVKILTKKNMNKNVKKAIRNEYEILANLDHPHIVKLYEIFEDQSYFYLVQQYCKGGQLFDEIIKRKFFDETNAQFLMK